MKNFLMALFLAQFLSCFASAGQDDMPAGPPATDGTNNGYDVSGTIKRGEDVILKQKELLEEGEKEAAEEKKIGKIEKLQEEEENVKREIYEQRIVEEAAMPRSMTTLERQLQREKFRRDIMAVAGREAKIPFKMTKKFSLRATETYDDNIFLEKEDKNSDFITKISPAALVSISSDYIILDANYVMDVVKYMDNDKQSGVSHLFMTYIRPGSLALPFFNRRRGKIGLEIQDEFQPLVTSVASSEQTSRTERTSNRLFLNADYYMSAKRTLSLEYTNIFEEYRKRELESFSYTENIITPKFYFHIRPKWSLFTGYDYGMIDYSKGDNSSTYQRLKTGITGTLFTKVLSNFEIGKEWRRYEDPVNGEAQKLIFKSAFMNKFTPALSSSLEYNHSMVESTYGNNPYYVSDNIYFDLEYKFSYKTVGTFGLDLIRNTYDRVTTEEGVTQNRLDNMWQTDFGLRYYFKRWLYAIFNYTYKKRTSNFGLFDYVDNVITGGISSQF
ncbi:MAG: outer membrane beta-barrel protein [Candidatus Omnitrophica bacterium]|nr:outer membrane beta-barrel protein [Candidatus Omnitrophota bacterium]